MAKSKKRKNTKTTKSSDYKKAKKRVFILILLLVLMILLLGSGTYAWFSSNKHGTIESIDLENKIVNALVDLFGQETSIEVELKQIDRA